MIEKPTKGVHGYFLYSPVTKKHFFRVYGADDPVTGHKTFTDYDVCAEEIAVKLECSGDLSLYESNERNRLDWSGRVLGKESKDGQI